MNSKETEDDTDHFSSFPYWNFQDALEMVCINNQSKQIAQELQDLIAMRDTQALTTTKMIRKLNQKLRYEMPKRMAKELWDFIAMNDAEFPTKIRNFKRKTCEDGMIERWDYKGAKYFRNSENKVWVRKADGELGDWVGIYLPNLDQLEYVEWSE